MHPSASLHVRCRTQALLALGLALLLPLVAYPQSSNSNGAANGNANGAANGKGNGKSDADNDWDGLMAVAAGSANQSSNTDQAASALAFANQARDYAAKYPQSSKAAEARKLEGIYLVHAVDAGDSADSDRMSSTVNAIRHDTTVPSYQRAAVAGTYEFSRASKNVKNADEALTSYESAARGLMVEFPDQPQGSQSLLTMAAQHDATTAHKMALEVLALKNAPVSITNAATSLATRTDLVGKSVDSILPASLPAKSAWVKKRPGVIYFWSASAPGSLQLGQFLASRITDGLNVIGVNLDSDPVMAKARADASKLPGAQIYANTGAGDFAASVGADTAPLLFIIDKNGKVTDVFGTQGLESKLAAVGL